MATARVLVVDVTSSATATQGLSGVYNVKAAEGTSFDLMAKVKCIEGQDCTNVAVTALVPGGLQCSGTNDESGGGRGFGGYGGVLFKSLPQGQTRTAVFTCKTLFQIPEGLQTAWVTICEDSECPVGSLLLSIKKDQAPRSPGFEAPFAVAVLLGVALLIRRQRS